LLVGNALYRGVTRARLALPRVLRPTFSSQQFLIVGAHILRLDSRPGAFAICRPSDFDANRQRLRTDRLQSFTTIRASRLVAGGDGVRHRRFSPEIMQRSNYGINAR